MCRFEALAAFGAGWFEWSLRVNTTVKGNNIWGFSTCYQLGYLKYAALFEVPP